MVGTNRSHLDFFPSELPVSRQAPSVPGTTSTAATPLATAVPSSGMPPADEAQNLRWEIERLRLIAAELARTTRFLRQTIVGLCGFVAIVGSVVLWQTITPDESPNPTPAQPAASPATVAPAPPPVASTATVAPSPPVKEVAAAPGLRPKDAGSSVVWGRLTIVSNPRDAMVSIDRQRVGRTPLSSVPARAGKRTIWIDLSDYQRWVGTIEVSPDGVGTIDATLVPRGSARSRQRR